METYINNTSKNRTKFIVAINEVNNSKSLLPSTLYKKMEEFALVSIASYKDILLETPNISKLNILKNAYLNDELMINSKIVKFDGFELVLAIDVFKELENSKDTICNAYFNFKLKQNNLIYAS